MRRGVTVCLALALAVFAVSGCDFSRSPGSTADPNAAYRAVMVRHAESLSSSTAALGDLFDPPRYGDSAWVERVAATVLVWPQVDREARALTPPADYAAFHARYLAMTALLSKAADDFAYGAAIPDEQMVAVGWATLGQAEQVRDELTALLPS